MSKFLHHEGCPKCGSSDGLAVYDDNVNCFVCGYHKKQGDNTIIDKHEVRHAVDRELTPIADQDQASIKDRGITSAVVNKYKVTVDTNARSPVGHVYPYFDQDRTHVANKIRRKGEKSFYWEGDVGRGCLFGQQLFPAGGKAITVVEGELDALSGYQLTGSRYPCVSVKSASEAKRNIADNFEYLNSFDKIVIAFDNDEPGQKAANQVAALFAPGKAHVLKLQKGKDANEYLVNGWEKEYVNEWFRSPPYLPDGILVGSDPGLLDDILNYVEPRSVPFPWNGLNRKTYGLRTSELTLLTADTGVGKTSVIKEVEYMLLMFKELIEENAGVGFLHLEEPKRDTALGLMSIHNNKPYHFPDVERTKKELVEAYETVLHNERVVIYDHFGSNEIDTILSKIRHMAAMGCRYIFLDHLSIIVSDQSGDERKQLDEISTKLKMLTMNLDICVVAVIHINRRGEVRGSAGPEQVANTIIRLERDKNELDDWRRNVTTVRVEKNRRFGRTGIACYLYYNEMTGRLEELDEEQARLYEAGGNMAGHEFDLMPQ